MAKRYGVPYGMSKNRIAKRLVDFLPPADTFVDLFAGGCAVAHAALESRKYNHVIINDINPLPTQLFVDAVAGKYRDERRVIDRETFHRLKNVDPYVKYCWSYGFNGKDYLWGQDNETEGQAWSKMILSEGKEQKEYQREFQKLNGYKIDNDLLNWILSAPDWLTRITMFTKYASRIRDVDDKRLTKGLRQLATIVRLQGAIDLQKLTRLTQDYRTVEIPSNSVIYCDIPYKGLEVPEKMGCGDFNEDDFCKWAQGKQNVFVSSYVLPELYFEGVRGWNLRATMSQFSHVKASNVLEKIFVPCMA